MIVKELVICWINNQSNKQLRATKQQNVNPGMADNKHPFLDLIALSLFCPGGIKKR